MAPVTGTFSLVTLNDLLPAIEEKALGEASLNLKLASGQVKTPAHLGGALPVDFTFHVGGDFRVSALNGQSGTDDLGVVAADGATTPTGQFTPPLRFDKVNGWLKYVAEADVKADVTASPAIVQFTGSAGKQIQMADYHRHPLGDGLRVAIPNDLKALRSAMVLNHVQNLPEGDALAFQTTGTLGASLDIEWSDVFTSEISRLARLLKTVAPIAIKTKVGASCSVKVSVNDTFLVVFARQAGGTLLVAVRTSNVKTIDAGAGATISASLADSTDVEPVLNDVVAGLLGTEANRLQALLDNLAAGALTSENSALAAVIVDRLKLAGVGQIDKAVTDLKAKASDGIKKLVESKVEASFSYEYHRVGSDASVFEAEIPAGGPLGDLHRELVGGDLAAAFNRDVAEIRTRKFLNDKSTTVRQAWGFTLGLNKWKVFGQDRREIQAVEHIDRVERTIQRNYVGSGGYSRTKLAWTVDFAADMAKGRPQPKVADYQFGLHIAILRDLQPFNSADLDTALDVAALWSICPETSLPFVRRELAPLVNQKAEWSFHLRVNDEALRPIFRVLGSMRPRDLAGAAAAALDATAIPSLLQRRTMYEPLWQAVLASAQTFNIETVRSSADALLKDPAMAHKERHVIEHQLFDQSSVATVVAFDTDWFGDCERFLRGCRLLADAIATQTPDDGTIHDVYSNLVGFWTQSHYVRTLGAALVDVARKVDHFNGIERILNLTSGATTIVLSSNSF